MNIPWCGPPGGSGGGSMGGSVQAGGGGPTSDSLPDPLAASWTRTDPPDPVDPELRGWSDGTPPGVAWKP